MSTWLPSSTVSDQLNQNALLCPILQHLLRLWYRSFVRLQRALHGYWLVTLEASRDGTWMASFEGRGFVQVLGMVTFFGTSAQWQDSLESFAANSFKGQHARERSAPKVWLRATLANFQQASKGEISPACKNICLTFNSLLSDAVTNNIKNSSSEASSNVEGDVNPLLR